MWGIIVSSFLTKKRNTKSFEEELSTKPIQTQRNIQYAVKLFEDFISYKYSEKTVEQVTGELKRLKKEEEQQTYEEALYGMLQDWIVWNAESGRSSYTIKVAFSNLRKYLFHLGIKTNEQDIKAYLSFNKRTHEERYPLSQDEYRKIVNGFGRNPRLQALFLALGSSGMRIGEALGLKKKDLDFSKSRIKVNIPANTKTRRGRSTYLSIETEKILKPILESLGSEDLIFSQKSTRLSDRSIRTSLNRILDRIGFVEKYQSNKFRKITSHSFRAYFFTKSARKHGENYAHRMTGHGGYLMQYDRMTEEEKLEMYIELEPELTIFDQTKNEMEIERLKKENQTIDELRQQVNELRKFQARQDKKILDDFREKGNLPTGDEK